MLFFTEPVLYVSSTWLAEHRCLLYRSRSWLNHTFCPGAQNKPIFHKFPSRAFLCCSALPSSALLVWLGRTKWYQDSSRWQIAMLVAIRPRALVQRETPEQMGQVLPSFLLHDIDIWFAPTFPNLGLFFPPCASLGTHSHPSSPSRLVLLWQRSGWPQFLVVWWLFFFSSPSLPVFNDK